MLDDLLALFFFQVHGAHEVVSDACQGIFGPGEEPVYVRVTDQAGEVTTTHSQSFAGRRHRQNDMKVLTAAGNEVVPSEFFGLGHLLLAHFIVEGVDEAVLFFFGEEGRHHSDGQDVVDQLQEAFFGDMGIREEEGLGLVEHDFVQVSEILPEIGLFVASDETDGEQVIAGSESGQLGERLLARSTETDEQTAALRESYDSVDFSHVLKGVVEEHQAHGFVLETIVFKHLVELLLNIAVITEILVKTRVFGFVVSGVGHGIIAEQDGVLEHVLIDILEILLDEVTHCVAANDVLVGLVEHPVAEDTHAFVSPEADEALLGVELVDGGLKQALVNAAEVSQVEDVMELHGGSGQLLDDSVIQTHRSLGHLGHATLDVVDEFIAVLLENLGVDLLGSLSRRSSDVEH
mmetsp:Transcript_20740/g.31956  ORF Transcript_20740/g.31956 Transcript_20740/m.31956 type:complete len:405 (+) Transcript_20740:4515-5729(+)